MLHFFLQKIEVSSILLHRMPLMIQQSPDLYPSVLHHHLRHCQRRLKGNEMKYGTATNEQFDAPDSGQ
jgi:hypothetical protein